MVHLDPFYPILPDTDWLALLLPLGISFVQLRIKDQDTPSVRAEIDKAIVLCAEHDCQLVVNDYWREAIEAGADFVHLGQEDLAGADLGALRAAGVRLGISTHSEAELATALSADPDYVALGPIYPTTLKAMPWAPQGLARLAEWRAKIKCPLVAIGGITLERAPEVLAAGADSVALVSDLTGNKDPRRRTAEWIIVTEPWRHFSTGFPLA
ncbi:MAG: thiamine phosphate synthase [Methyloceanibacter sp.]